MASLFRKLCQNQRHILYATSLKPSLNYKKLFSTTLRSCSNADGLMAFFDDEKNWDATRVQVGRSWRLDELRIKSNQDLHKLWYVLLKEKNMLLTTEKAYNREYRSFPNPERIDKVEESMENIESVVRERNKAYWLLETDELGERPSTWSNNALGLYECKPCEEHENPQDLEERAFKPQLPVGYREKFVEKYLKEKEEKQKEEEEFAKELIINFKDMEYETLKEHFPTIDYEFYKKVKDEILQ